MVEQFVQFLLTAHVLEPTALLCQIPGHKAYVAADGHLVVVEDHQQAVLTAPGVTQPLVGQTAGEGAVTDDRHGVAVVPGECLGLGDAVGHRHGGTAVPRHKGVVLTLRRIGEAGDATLLAQGIKPLVPIGQQLVGIALVSHVPDDSVLRGVEHLMQRHRQFHGAQIGGQMSAGAGHRVDQLLPQLGAQSGQLGGGHILNVLGRVNLVQVLHTFTFLGENYAKDQ